eukprot:2260232-Amphidinium_carterae.1
MRDSASAPIDPYRIAPQPLPLDVSGTGMQPPRQNSEVMHYALSDAEFDVLIGSLSVPKLRNAVETIIVTSNFPIFRNVLDNDYNDSYNFRIAQN